MGEEPLKSPFQGTNRFVVWGLNATTGATDGEVITFDSSETEDKDGDPLLKSMIIKLSSKIANRTFQTFKEAYVANNKVVEFEQLYSNGDQSTVRKVAAGVATFLGAWVDGSIDGEVQIYGGEFVATGDTGKRLGIQQSSLGDTPVECTAVSSDSPATKTISAADLYAALCDIIVSAASTGELTWGVTEIGSMVWASAK